MLTSEAWDFLADEFEAFANGADPNDYTGWGLCNAACKLHEDKKITIDQCRSMYRILDREVQSHHPDALYLGMAWHLAAGVLERRKARDVAILRVSVARKYAAKAREEEARVRD